MAKKITDNFKTQIGRRSKRNVEKLRLLMVSAGAVFPSGTPMTTQQINSLPGQPFRTHSLTNHLSKKPEFIDAGKIRVRNLDGTGTYPVSQWLASEKSISKTDSPLTKKRDDMDIDSDNDSE